jgi:altronate hydrolase
MQQEWLRLHPADNLVVALKDLLAGRIIDTKGKPLRLVEDIKAKHKFTDRLVTQGELLYMYGVLVGKTLMDIPAGALIHTGNVVHAVQTYVSREQAYSWQPPDVSKWKDRHFFGYHRADGGVGTANYWLVIPLVFCENRNVEAIRDAMVEQLGYGQQPETIVDVNTLVEAYRSGADEEAILKIDPLRKGKEVLPSRVFPNVDGIKFLTHDGGCGGVRQDSEVLCELLAGYISHPNVAGATVLSLGCQHAQISLLKTALEKRGAAGEKTVYFLEQQASKSERSFVAQAVKATFAGLMKANHCTRAPSPLSALTLGLECGGSDGFSGLSANPTLGHVSDMLVALKAKTVLAEFPELNGVEQELIDRCETTELADKFSMLMRAYSDAAEAVGSGFKNNPSPGNIRDGLITDAMKSAGAAKKGGSGPVSDVLDYAEPVTTPGLSLLCTPGNDVESTTGLAGSGCNLIVFTTGLGTPTGNPIVPVVKMSSNSMLAERMSDIIDFDAGPVITGKESIEERGEALLELLVDVASGTVQTAAQRLGQDDFSPWKRGVSL